MKSLVISPHPDDEILGCGGTLFKRIAQKHELGWIIVSSASEKLGWSKIKLSKRKKEINEIRELLKIKKKNFFSLDFETSTLSDISFEALVASLKSALDLFKPNEVFIPNLSDAHSDHRIVFDAASSCCKPFRLKSIKKVLSYETISESNFYLDRKSSFNPNYFEDISPYLGKKTEAMKIYKSEMGQFPFPRNKKTIEAQAIFRGSFVDFKAAEAFELLLNRD
tara:strand:- start:18015 stop:18683 length:669 start_codon:yes stop_codon:yes gene_type:complete